jgi:hypothetical protein
LTEILVILGKDVVGTASASAVLAAGPGPSPSPPSIVKVPIMSTATSVVPMVLTSQRSDTCGRTLRFLLVGLFRLTD